MASLEILQKLARRMQNTLIQQQNTKVTFSEYLKLLQLIKEAQGDKPRNITVRWIDPDWLQEEDEDPDTPCPSR